MRGISSNQRGFSLIEVLAALSILSIVSVSLMGYFLQGLDVTKDQHQHVIAAHYAKKKIHELREHFQMDDNYTQLYTYLLNQSSSTILFNDHELIKNSGTITELTSLQLQAVMDHCLDFVQLDSSTYRFLLEIDRRLEADQDGDGVYEQTRIGQLNGISRIDTSSKMLKAKVTVYWTGKEALTPGAKDCISVDFYLNEG